MLLALGMFVSLMHCAGCEFALAGDQPAFAAASDNGAPYGPEQFPAHCGHCLRHVTPQLSASLAVPADRIAEKPAPGDDRAPRPLTGLPLFKPPRA